MANSTNSLSHKKRLCKYHIVIVPKYRRKNNISSVQKRFARNNAEGYYVSTVGLNESTIKKYIQDQEKARALRRGSVLWAFSPCANRPFDGWL